MEAAGREAVDPLSLLLGVGIEHELLAVSQHPLSRQPPMGLVYVEGVTHD
jgi:hypothetical protein